MDNNKKIALIKKLYKNTDMLFDLYLENYHNFYIYIRLDYYKKLKLYKLSWIDLANIDNKDIASTISYEYIPLGIIGELEQIAKNININKYEKITKDEYKVTINNNLFNNKFTLIFNRYIPKELSVLFNLLVVIFDNLPRKLNSFLEELGAEIIGNTKKYEYTEEFKFDLFNDDLDKLFDYQIIERGKEYHKEGRVFFLEKIKDRYFAVVGGKNILYVVIIKYDEENKKTSVYCSCPCEFYCKHIYAVILAIRNNELRKFYKITHNSNDLNLLDRIMNFNFLLTIGIDDDGNNYLVIEDGQLKLLPVLNNNGKSEWIVLEDDEKETLTKRLNDIVK